MRLETLMYGSEWEGRCSDTPLDPNISPGAARKQTLNSFKVAIAASAQLSATDAHISSDTEP